MTYTDKETGEKYKVIENTEYIQDSEKWFAYEDEQGEIHYTKIADFWQKVTITRG